MTPRVYSIRTLDNWRSVGEVAIEALLPLACSLDIDAIVATDRQVPSGAEQAIHAIAQMAGKRRSWGIGRWRKVLTGITLDPLVEHDRQLFVRAALWVIDANAWAPLERRGHCGKRMLSASDTGDTFWFDINEQGFGLVSDALDRHGYDPSDWLAPAGEVYPSWRG